MNHFVLFFAITTIILLQHKIIQPIISLSLPSTNIDRFRASCPVDIQTIHQFDPNIIPNQSNNNIEEEEVWCAIYRSTNNLPSVFMRDDFFQSMKIATTTITDKNKNDIITSSSSSSSNDGNTEIPYIAKPVAIGRLVRKSSSNINQSNNYIYILDILRCVLKKENTDESCDGGSEHTEAISTCIDTLLLHYLETTSEHKKDSSTEFDETSLQCKATLVSSPLIEARGFVPIQALNREMTTHISSLDKCMEMYATKVASDTTSANSEMSPGARMKALTILSLLGQLDPKEKENGSKQDDDEEEEEYDPWASMKQFI